MNMHKHTKHLLKSYEIKTTSTGPNSDGIGIYV